MTPNVVVDNLSKTNLYIRGLQSNTNDEDLYNMCRDYGQISSTKAIIDKATGYCRGYGFVEFADAKSAELAVKELTKSGVQAQMAKITQPFYNQHQQNQNHQHSNNNYNHKNNVQTKSTTNNSNPDTSNSNNSNFSNSNANANNSIANSNNNNNDNNNYINNVVSPSSNQDTGGQMNNNNNNNLSKMNNYSDPTNLYIANLPPNMTEQELENLLSQYGPVVSTRILRDQSNVPRGVGFARMETREKCEQIIKLLNGKPFEGSKEPLLLKFADSGNKKRRPHNNHHHNHQHQSQHQNNNLQNNNNNTNHQRQHKSLHYDSRWRDSSNASDLGSVYSLEHQTNTSHSDHLSDLSMLAHMSYPRMQPGFPPNAVTGGGSYPNTIVSPSSAPQWIASGSGQPYVIPQQVIQSGGLGPPTQSSSGLHYGHISQLTYQMQNVQIGHHEPSSVANYMPPQHQWSSLWGQPITSQPAPQGTMRLPVPIQQQQQQQQQQQVAPAPVILPSQQQQ